MPAGRLSHHRDTSLSTIAMLSESCGDNEAWFNLSTEETTMVCLSISVLSGFQRNRNCHLSQHFQGFFFCNLTTGTSLLCSLQPALQSVLLCNLCQACCFLMPIYDILRRLYNCEQQRVKPQTFSGNTQCFMQDNCRPD